MKTQHEIFGRAKRVCGLFLLAMVGLNAFGDQLKVSRITPTGEEVPSQRGIFIEFDRAMVPLGSFALKLEDVPVSIKPEIACEWTWINRNVLACQLGSTEKMRKATKYEIVIGPGLLAADGSELSEPIVHTFITELPRVSDVRVLGWNSPTEPILRIVFNQRVTQSSLEENLRLMAKTSRNFVQVDVSPDHTGGSIPREIFFDAQLNEHPRTDEAAVAWNLTPRTPLPPGEWITLMQRPGVRSAKGKEIHRDSQTYENLVRTFEDFRLVSLKCRTTLGRTLRATAHDGELKLIGRCGTQQDVRLVFSSPVDSEVLNQQLMLRPTIEGEFRNPHWSGIFNDRYERNTTQYFEARLPRKLEAFADYEVAVRSSDAKHSTAQFVDMFGRELAVPFRLSFSTDHHAPHASVSSSAAILEADIESDIPVYVRNIDEIRFDYRLLATDGHQWISTHRDKVPQVDDVAMAVPLGVREILGDAPGAVYGTLSANSRYINITPRRKIFAQVTPYQVFVKQGLFDTLVWVTDMKSGDPVQNLRVQLYRGKVSTLGPPTTDALNATTNAEGIAILPGYQDYDPSREIVSTWSPCSEFDCEAWVIRVEGERGTGILPLIGKFSLSESRASDYRVYTRLGSDFDRLTGWGFTSQGIYRRDDLVQFKLYIRGESNRQKIPAPSGPYLIRVSGPRDSILYEIDDAYLDEFGSLHGEFRVPKNAIMGWYRFDVTSELFTLPNDNSSIENDENREPYRISSNLQFFVTDFTPSEFSVSQELNGNSFKTGDPLSVSSKAEFHSGGAYANANAEINAEIRARYPSFENPDIENFRFRTPDRETHATVANSEIVLDSEGTNTLTVRLENTSIPYGTLRVESMVRSDRGKYVSAVSNVPFYGVDRFVGIKSDDRFSLRQNEEALVTAVVVDEKGNVQHEAPVRVVIERRIVSVARVRSAGNAYLPRYHDTWELAGECTFDLVQEPLECTFVPEHAGRYRATAEIFDTENRLNRSRISLWVAGEGTVVWQQPPGHQLEMSCTEQPLQAGDSLECLIQNPLEGGEALITVERYGVLEHFVKKFESSTPIIEIPIKPEYSPGFYLSVIVVAPRITDPPKYADHGETLDLGKPTYRMGYAAFKVSDKRSKLGIALQSNRDEYKPGDTVTVSIRNTNENSPNEPIEYVALAIDEAVFELIRGGLDYFDPATGFDRLGSLGVKNFGLIAQLVGYRGFASKGDNAGGGGGQAGNMRFVDKFVCYWNPSINSKNGNARFSFELPGNLTSWRIIVIGSTPTNQFGLGHISIVSTRETELRPLAPNVVSIKDQFDVGVSVLNRTEKARSLKVELKAEGLIEGERARHVEQIDLGPFERKNVLMNVAVAASRSNTRPGSMEEAEVRIEARARDRMDQDGLVLRIPVRVTDDRITNVSFGVISDEPRQIPIELGDPQPDTAQISVKLTSTAIGNIDGVFRYAKDYPYGCWEQRLSKAIIAAYYNELLSKKLVSDVGWLGSNEVPLQLFEDAPDFQAGNGGVAFWNADEDSVNPYLSAFTAMSFAWLEELGYSPNALVQKNLHAYLDSYLRRNTNHFVNSRSLVATTRAVALNALSRSSGFDVNELYRYEADIPYMDLFGLAHYLEAILNTDSDQMLIRKVLERMSNYASRASGNLEYIQEVPDSFRYILHSNTRTNCQVLRSLVRAATRSPSVFGTAELSSLVNAISLYRGKQSHWTNTQENLYCVSALVQYANTYEPSLTNMNGRASLTDLRSGRITRLGQGFARAPSKKELLFTRQLTMDMFESAGELQMDVESDRQIYYEASVSWKPRVPQQSKTLSGIELRRQYFVRKHDSWEVLDPNEFLRRGDLVVVNLVVSVPSDRYFVVVDDQVPGGLETVNVALVTESSEGSRMQYDKELRQHIEGEYSGIRKGRYYFKHNELGHSAVRFYADFLPAGTYYLTWVGQAVATGSFNVQPAHAEEMYRPTVFGKSSPMRLMVVDE